MRALDQPGNVDHDERFFVGDAHDAELRLERGERIIGDLRAAPTRRPRAAWTCRRWERRRSRNRRAVAVPAAGARARRARRVRQNAALGERSSRSADCPGRRVRLSPRAAGRRPPRDRPATTSGARPSGDRPACRRERRSSDPRRSCRIFLRCRRPCRTRPKSCAESETRRASRAPASPRDRCCRRGRRRRPPGPPFGTYFSRRHATMPSPPSPAATSISASSMNCTAATSPDKEKGPNGPGRSTVKQRAYAGGTTEICLRSRRVLNSTTPSTSAKSVWSRPMPDVGAGVEARAALANQDISRRSPARRRSA